MEIKTHLQINFFQLHFVQRKSSLNVSLTFHSYHIPHQQHSQNESLSLNFYVASSIIKKPKVE